MRKVNIIFLLFMLVGINVNADDYVWSSIQLQSGELSGYAKTSNPVFSPDGSTMYVPTSSPNGHLFAIDVATGDIQWVFEIDELTYGGGALVGNDGTIYQGSDAAIYAINPNGTQKWKITTDGSGALARVRAFPALSANGTLYCLSNSTFYAINVSSGDEIWAKPLPNESTIGSAVLIDGDGVIYVGTNKGMFAYASDGNTKWSNTDALLNVTESGSMAIDGNTLYAALKGTAGVAAINTADGTLKWNAEATGDAYFPIVDKNGVVYFVEKHASANVYAINPDGTQKWLKNIGGSLNYGGLVLDENGIIYGGTQGKVEGNYKRYAINTASGEFVFNDDNEQQIMAAFTIGLDKRLYFGTIGTSTTEGGLIQALNINAGLETGSWSIRGGNLQGTNCVTKKETAISSVQQTVSYEIKVKNNSLEMKASVQGTLSVFDLTGKVLFNKTVEAGSNRTVSVLPHSVYLVKFNNEVAKVIIR
ncbi:MAG: PQQ-binding-like beta-propeller repeat protein [Dysgonamonadaceae bacterium]|jgi:outer membrane protein assembly factor BamB|nr:PQQ-binding-like beta-propeller repeat protein [Dysgonamonadaceae bacterium]